VHAKLLSQISLTANAGAYGDTLAGAVPPTRSDVLRECDIVEDAAIAHGFDHLPAVFPHTKVMSVAKMGWQVCKGFQYVFTYQQICESVIARATNKHAC
jgi:phenylalanyl-tRNA synthetase beta subunit